MKTEDPAVAIIKIALQGKCDTAEGNVMPGDFARLEQRHFQAFFAGRIFRDSKVGAIEEVDLIDVGNADHGKRGVNDHFGARFLKGFSYGGISGRFAIFHKAGGERPRAEAGFDGPPTEQKAIFPGGDAADDQAGVLVMNVAAAGADMSGPRVAGRDGEGDISSAVIAVSDHEYSMQTVMRPSVSLLNWPKGSRQGPPRVSSFALRLCLWLQ